MLRGNSISQAPFAATQNRSRPDPFSLRTTSGGDYLGAEQFAKRRRLVSSPDQIHQSLQPPMRSYPTLPIPSRAVQYSGSYPGIKTLGSRDAYRPPRHGDCFDESRALQNTSPQLPRGRRIVHASTSSLPGLSSLLHSSKSSPPPQHRPLRRLDAPPINVTHANHSINTLPHHQRTMSWSSNGSPTESPLVARGGGASVSSRPHWGEAYGQYYQHPQRLGHSHSTRDDLKHRLVSSPDAVTTGSSSPPSTGSLSGDEPIISGKNSRYLREMDRRAILERLANGEKQAALAKEFQVSRAAICNLNKHRDEVMSRADENPFAKHPKKRKVRAMVVPSAVETAPDNALIKEESSTSRSSTPTSLAAVHVVQSRAVNLLMTTLRNHVTPLAAFRRCSERVMRLVIEDALALVPTKPVDVYLNDQVKVEGVGMEHAPCGISLEQRHCPMLDMFHVIEPDQPTGYVRLHKGKSIMETSPVVTLLDAHLPGSLRFHNVFLFDLVATSSETLCATLQQLKDRGAIESMLHVVALFVSSDVVAAIQCTFPRVQIVTAQIDASLSKKKTQRTASVDNMLARFAQVYSDSV